MWLRLSSGPDLFLSLALSSFHSSQPTIKLRECGHNLWSCWLTPRRPTSSALLCLITSIAVSHKGVFMKGHWSQWYLKRICCGWGTSYIIHHVSCTVMHHRGKKGAEQQSNAMAPRYCTCSHRMAGLTLYDSGGIKPLLLRFEKSNFVYQNYSVTILEDPPRNRRCPGGLALHISQWIRQ